MDLKKFYLILYFFVFGESLQFFTSLIRQEPMIDQVQIQKYWERVQLDEQLKKHKKWFFVIKNWCAIARKSLKCFFSFLGESLIFTNNFKSRENIKCGSLRKRRIVCRMCSNFSELPLKRSYWNRNNAVAQLPENGRTIGYNLDLILYDSYNMTHANGFQSLGSLKMLLSR